MNGANGQGRADVDPIKHVVVLVLENRSFDQMLGVLSKVPHLQDLEGVDFAQPYSNTVAGEPTPYYHTETRSVSIDPDPKHELWNVLRQINRLTEYRPSREIGFWQWGYEWARVAGRLGFAWARERVLKAISKIRRPLLRKLEIRDYAEATKFVEDYAKSYPKTTRKQRQEVMGYFPLDFLPALHSLGREYAVCDHWHSSVPGPTWANRFFVHTGSAVGRVWMPDKPVDLLNRRFRPYTQDTVYRRLDEKGKSWRIYFGDIPQTLVLANQLFRKTSRNTRSWRISKPTLSTKNLSRTTPLSSQPIF